MVLIYISTSPAKAQHTDTTFISRKKTKDYYWAIYIEKNRQSKKYKNLLDFKMNKWDAKNYKESLDSLKKRKIIKIKALAGLPKEWLPLYLYKGKYYIYYPCEWDNGDRRILTDSTLVDPSMEGPIPRPLQTVKKINANTYYLQLKAFYSIGPPISTLIIHIIDAKNNIAVWEDTSQQGPYRYGLYVAKQSAANFDMVVNYCDNNRVPEFEFDKIDYTALLKGH
ncbi:hypothetical protein [Mucilaginibacter gracilis]|nr:hypothetical protein [Mucilaginibacter gracilis]